MKRMFVSVAILVASGVMAHGETPEETLQSRVREYSTSERQSGPRNLREIGQFVSFLRKNPAAKPAACTEARKVPFGGRYAISFDAANNPCRIYDLSFPTMRSLFARNPVSRLPVQKVTAKDYLNWAEGNYDQVYQQMAKIKSGFEPRAAIAASWVSQIKFRGDTGEGLQAQALRDQGQLPRTFHASDLDVGDFRLSDADRAQIKSVGEAARELIGDSGLSSQSTEQDDAWQTLADKPKTLLQKIRFDWNDVDKVYDVFIEGEFLPMHGPIVLVDFNQPYKNNVESVLRGSLRMAVRLILRAVPLGAARDVVDIAVTDTFDFIDLAYAYQMNQLEQTLRLAPIPSEVPATDLSQRGLDILFGERSSLLSAYILAAAKGEKFDWKAIETIGKKSRYTDEKNRDIAVTNMNSQMTLKKGCEMQIFDGVFGVCTKSSKKVALYSLMSSTKVLAWDLGAPVVFNYDHPASVTMMRSTTWLLAAGARLVQIPIIGGLKYSLANMLKTYARSGLSDEAYLRAALSLHHSDFANFDTTAAPNVEKWLYVQNINPFLPKSAAAEQNVIQANASLLGISTSNSNLRSSPTLGSP